MRLFCSKFASVALVFAALLMVACTNELKETTGSERSNAPVIYATQEASPRTSLSVDGEGVGTIYWSPADEISIFYGASSPVLYTSTNLAPETTAAFTTNAIIGSSELSSTNIWGLYPYNSSAVCDGTSVTTTLPATQYAVAGTFDDDLFITLAHSDNTNLHFYNVCGGIKFSLSRDDITSITFAGNNNEDLAGDITVSFVDGLPSVSVDSGEKTITLTPKGGGTFAADTDYYIITLPNTLSSGFTMEFETNSGLTGVFDYSSTAVSVLRSKFGKKDDIDSFAEFSIPLNQIWYTSTDGEIVSPKDVFGANIISNEYTNGIGIISFDNDIDRIGNLAFDRRTSLLTVTIPNGVTSIGYGAFYGCTGLSSVSIPNGVTGIGQGAFQDCSNLSSITLPDSMTGIIGSQMFSRCSNLSSITIPDGVTSIGDSAFSGCSGLLSITISNSVTSIGYGAFYGCSGLSSITIPDGVTSIGGSAFSGCSGLSSFTIPSGVTSIGDDTFSGCSGLLSITIPDGVTSIGEKAFKECSSLSSLTIPDSVTGVIGDQAFYGCSGLSSFTIPSGVTNIGDDTFSGCSGLSSIVIPESVRYIGGRAFYGCSGLLSITIPSGVTSIENRTFYGCSGLSSITIPDGVTYIRMAAFGLCSNLSSITIPDSVRYIEGSAFSRCTSLTTITIPAGVTTMNTFTLYGCTSLQSLTVLAETPPSATSDNFLGDVDIEGLSIYVPAGSVDAYKSASYWSSYASRVFPIE